MADSELITRSEYEARHAAIESRMAQLENKMDTRFSSVEIKFDKIIDKVDKLGGDVDTKIDSIQKDIYKNRTSTLWWMLSNIATFLTGGGLFALAQYFHLLR